MRERPIRSLITNQHPVTASCETTVADAAYLMKERRVGAVLVMNEGRLAGIFTERDALFRVIAEGRDPAATRLADVMSANPRTIGPDRPFGHALHMMHEGGFRHVPVGKVFVTNDQPWQGIIDTAKAKKCDLIVMASHGRKGITGLIIGSETHKVLTHSKTPVLVCR